MFFGSLPETKSEICISDTDDAAFREFLRFIYTDSCQLTLESAVKVMYLGKKYMDPSLTEKCVKKLKKGIKAENVATVLEQTLCFDEVKLTEQCWEVIELETESVVTSEGFNEIGQNTLTSLLKRESLKISEVKLFQAVIQWCDNQCLKNGLETTGENRRSVLGDALYQISFLSMTHQEFAQHVATSRVLTDAEIVPMLVKLCGCDPIALKWNPPNRQTRIPEKQIRFARCRLSEVARPTPDGKWTYKFGKPDYLCFTVDKQVHFRGFRLLADDTGSK